MPCLNERHFNPQTSHVASFINSDYSKSSIYGRKGTTILYDHYITLTSHETLTFLGAKYTNVTFNRYTVTNKIEYEI